MTDDFRYAVRLARQRPGLTALALLTLALGIGATTALFSLVEAVLLRPLPFRDPDRLVMVWEHNLPRDRPTNVVSPGNFLHWQELTRSFERLAGVSPTVRVSLAASGEPEEVAAQLVSAALFPLLGVEASLGRTFLPDEDRPGSAVVLLGDRLWRRRFRADPAIVGRTVTVDGRALTVVGVMPPWFAATDADVELWLPLGLPAAARTPRGRSLVVFGRLKPGVTVAQAQADMTRVAGDLARLFPDVNTGWTARVVPLQEQMVGAVRPALLVLFGAVALVLLVACANVANLLLVRATARQREMAVRAALGANHRRLVRQLLVESLALSATGGALGLGTAWLVLRAFGALAVARLPGPRPDAMGIDLMVLLFAVATSLASGLAAGLAPVTAVLRSNLVETLKEGARTATSARGHRLRGALVVAEVALALVLLVGAGLLVRSFVRILAVEPGFDPARAVTLRLTLPRATYGSDARRVGLISELVDRIGALPGVQAAGGVSFLPLAGPGAATRFEVVGRPKPPLGEEPVCDVRVVAGDYFAAMGIPLLRGRMFTGRELREKTPAILVNDALARRHWPGEDPIGRQLVVSWTDAEPSEVVGVVADVRLESLAMPPRPTVYFPYPRTAYPSMALVVRSHGDPLAVVPAVVEQVRRLDRDVPVADIRPLAGVVSRAVGDRRVIMLLLAAFAAAALALAGVGIYGVMATTVAERTHEMGVRLALGAAPGDVLRLVVSDGVRLAGAGVGLGAVGAASLGRWLRSLLFEVPPGDPVTFGATAALAILVAVVASLVPALRASRVDPAIALRAE